MNNLKVLQLLLVALRSAHWSHWTSHWQVKGSSFYGDHELMERLYAGLVDEIDTLAEKIVSNFGSDSVNPVEQAQAMANVMMPVAEDRSNQSPLERALFVEDALQIFFKAAYNYLKKSGFLTLGMDDFIMSMANNHETNLYLLRQRLNKNPSKTAFNKYNPTELVGQLLKVLSSHGLHEAYEHIKRHKVPQVVNDAWVNRHLLEELH
jgi:DNA-binding ferritin-like protein